MLDKLTVRRRGELGRIGELIAVEELSAHGFTAILLLRERNQIYPFADIYAEREGRKFWISVKTRNKYRANGTLNTRYKIPANQTERAHDLEQAHPGADAAFIAISVVLSRKSCRCNEPPHSYSCYFGPLTILTRRNGIGMREEERSLYECFAENKPIPDNYDVSNLDNAHDHIKASSHEDSVVHESGGNLFEDLGLPDAGAHFLKAQMVAEINRLVTERGLNQTDAAAVMGFSQPEVSRFFRGNLREYSVDRLMAFLTAFDQDVEIVSRPRNRAAGDARGKIVFKAAAA